MLLINHKVEVKTYYDVIGYDPRSPGVIMPAPDVIEERLAAYEASWQPEEEDGSGGVRAGKQRRGEGRERGGEGRGRGGRGEDQESGGEGCGQVSRGETGGRERGGAVEGGRTSRAEGKGAGRR